MIRLAAPAAAEEDVERVVEILRSGDWVQGRWVEEFEREVAERIAVPYAIAVSSGTAALHLSLLALGIGPGDEVAVPDFTFPATANVVEMVGAQPLLVDIDPATFNVTPSALEEAINPRTKAIIPVHLFGRPAPMGEILALARKHGLVVVEDAAGALGSEYRGRPCGTLGDAGCFSFHARKVVSCGEGGMVVTSRAEVAERVRRLRDHGLRRSPDGDRWETAGLNCRMTDFQAALGVGQVKRLSRLLAHRSELAGVYRQLLAGLRGVRLPSPLEEGRHGWQAFVVLLEEGIRRERVVERLRSAGVEAGIGTYALHLQPHGAGAAAAFPHAERAYRQGLSLPLHARMDSDDVREVCRRLQQALEGTA